MTGLRALLQSRRDGGPCLVVERALQALEVATLRRIETFEAHVTSPQHTAYHVQNSGRLKHSKHNVSNTLHIMATLVPELEGWAEALAGTFIAQKVAITQWAACVFPFLLALRLVKDGNGCIPCLFLMTCLCLFVRTCLTARKGYKNKRVSARECSCYYLVVSLNGALDASVKEKLDNYQHNYNERNVFFP